MPCIRKSCCVFSHAELSVDFWNGAQSQNPLLVPCALSATQAEPPPVGRGSENELQAPLARTSRHPCPHPSVPHSHIGTPSPPPDATMDAPTRAKMAPRDACATRPATTASPTERRGVRQRAGSTASSAACVTTTSKGRSIGTAPASTPSCETPTRGKDQNVPGLRVFLQRRRVTFRCFSADFSLLRTRAIFRRSKPIGSETIAFHRPASPLTSSFDADTNCFCWGQSLGASGTCRLSGPAASCHSGAPVRPGCVCSKVFVYPGSTPPKYAIVLFRR